MSRRGHQGTRGKIWKQEEDETLIQVQVWPSQEAKRMEKIYVQREISVKIEIAPTIIQVATVTNIGPHMQLRNGYENGSDRTP